MTINGLAGTLRFMHEAFQTETMRKAEAARQEAARKQREMLGTFAQVQFAMYAAHQNDFNPHHMRKLELEVERFRSVLSELRSTEDQLVVAMSPAEQAVSGVGVGMTPAEIAGAQARESLQETNDSE